MKRRKGWHRKKRRLKHDYRAQFRNTLANHYRRRMTMLLEESERGVVSPLQVAVEMLLCDEQELGRGALKEKVARHG